MEDSDEYWKPICSFVMGARYWVRFSVRDDNERWISDWGTLMLVPVTGYLELEGPVPSRQVEWVELSTLQVAGGSVARPLELIDRTEDIVSFLIERGIAWNFVDTIWSVMRIFDGMPVRAVRIANPFYRGPPSSGPP